MVASKPIRRPGLIVKEVGREIILYGSNDQEIHVLNSTAKLIWELCDGKHTAEEMGQSIRSNFSVPSGIDLVEDIQKTLRGFDQKGLLVDTEPKRLPAESRD
jgi:hypothetical protein